ncbi:MAG: sulfatase [Verrucomicrobia bacterium]|nr:sulfatase [Verrucomicrobiota bacterium]
MLETSSSSNTSAPKPGRALVSPLRAALWLAVVLVGAKAVLLEPPRSPRWLLDFAVVSFQDVLFAVTLGVVAEIVARMAARRPMLAHIVRGASLAFFMLCAFYVVLAVGIFQYFSRPLTYDLLSLVRNAATIQSSVSERLTVPIVAAFIAVPVGYLGVALWACRRRSVPVWALAVAGLWIAAGLWEYAPQADDWEYGQLALCPHVELVRSTAVGLSGARQVTFPKDFPQEDLAEFRPLKSRGTPPGWFKPPAGTARPRNVIVVVLESVGTRYLSLYGSRYETTPSLIAESAHAMVFDDFYSHLGYTFCSFMAISSSIYPGLPWCYAPTTERPPPPSLASVLRARGRRTVYLQSGDMDWNGGESWIKGFGFDEAHDYREFGCPRLSSESAEERYLVDRLLRWIDAKRGQPFLALCWTDQTHDPYTPSPGAKPMEFLSRKPGDTRSADLSRYLNALRETDRQLGRLFAALRERGLADDTLVVVTGDHGEAFREPHKQRGHGFTVYQEDVHVPLMLWNPRLFPAGRRVATIGSHMDLNPTITDILGAEPAGEWQGRSLFEPARPPRAYFVASVGDYQFGIREEQWKYILNTTRGREMLFDLAHDPDEQRNMATAEPERCRRLRQRLAAWVSFEEEFLRGRGN